MTMIRSRAKYILSGVSVFALGLCAIANAAILDRPFLKASAVVVVMGGDTFSEDGGTAPFVVDFNMLTSAPGTAANDLILADGVTMNYNTGQYNAISNGAGSGYEFEIIDPVSGGVFTSVGPHQTLDANDVYSEFAIDNNTTIDLVTGNRGSQFLVASNAPFDIYAQASDLVATGDFSTYGYNNIRYTFSVKVLGASGVWRHGQRAQDPSVGGSGIVTAIKRLSHMSAGPTKVFDGGRRTAFSRGTLLQQSVRFKSSYKLAGAGSAVNNYDLSMGAGALGATVTYTVYTP